MMRLTMSLDDHLAEAFDAIVAKRGCANRSEAFRHLLRGHIGSQRQAEHPKAPASAR